MVDSESEDENRNDLKGINMFVLCYCMYLSTGNVYKTEFNNLVRKIFLFQITWETEFSILQDFPYFTNDSTNYM